MNYKNRIIGLEYVDAAELTPHPGNWRKHGKAQVDALRGVLSEVGIADALLAYRSERDGGKLTVIDGHLRKDAAPQTWPVLVLDVSDAEADYILATHDPLAAMADADTAALDSLLTTVSSDDGAVRQMLAELAAEAGIRNESQGEDPGPQEDKAEELRQKWQTAPGQMWLLDSGKGHPHRLICGDCTDRAVVERVMGGERAALFATDPPYLVDYDGTNHPHKWGTPDENKDLSETYHDWDNSAQGEELYDGFIAMAVAHAILPNAAWYCWHASRRQAWVEKIWERHGAFVHQQIVWVKDRPVLTRSHYLWRHEPCFYGWIRGKEPTRRSNDYPHTVWEIPTVLPGQKTLHPTSKPLEVFAIPMRQHTLPGELCYEPFSGSGSQILAAEQIGRRCLAVEISPEYVAVALERFFVMVGVSPVLLEAEP